LVLVIDSDVATNKGWRLTLEQ